MRALDDRVDLLEPVSTSIRSPHRELCYSAPLIGREAELAEVTGLLAAAAVRLVTVTGRSGVGKTRLALEAARGLDAVRPGTVWLVSLALVHDPELVVAEVAAQLQLTAGPGVPVADALVRWLRRSAGVLLLDNFEHLLAAAGVLANVLAACPQLKLLVTSQAPLRLTAERVIDLDTLALPEPTANEPSSVALQPAVALYCDRATAVNSQFRLGEDNVAAVVTLCRELEGLPLAIELAAARAPTLPAGELVTRLARQRLDVLRSPRADAPARHQGMRGAIGWTYHLLSDFERRLLRRLSAAGGAFDIDDAEALGSAEPADVLDALSSLVDFHLISPVSAGGLARFELAPSIRDFAAEELASSREAAEVQDRWITWLASRARAAAVRLTEPAPDAEWLWLEASHDCLRNALQACFDGQRADRALDLLAGLAAYWDARATHSAHIRLLDRAIDLADDQGIQSAALAEALLWSGLMGTRVLITDSADHYVERLRRGEEQARELADDRLIMLGAHCRILTTVMTGDVERGIQAGTEGLEIARRRGETSWVSRFELHSARWAQFAGDQDKAVALGLAALNAARRTADTRAVLNAAFMLQTVAPSSPAAAAAVPAPRELLAVARATHQRVTEAILLPLLALQSAAAGDVAAAAGWCAEGLEISGFDPTSYPAGFALFAAVEIASRHGDHELAARIHGRLQETRSRLHAAMSADIVTAHKVAVDDTRQALGADAFDAVMAAGTGLSWEAAITEVTAYLRTLARPTVARTAIAETTGTATTTNTAAPDSGQQTRSRLPTLTDRQMQVVQLLVGGLTNKEIAARLGLTPKTVMHHTVAIYQRLGVRGRSEAVARAIRAGVAPASLLANRADVNAEPPLCEANRAGMAPAQTRAGATPSRHDALMLPPPSDCGVEFGRAACDEVGL